MGSSSSHVMESQASSHGSSGHGGGVILDAPLDREHELQVHERDYRDFLGLLKGGAISLAIVVTFVIWAIAT